MIAHVVWMATLGMMVALMPGRAVAQDAPAGLYGKSIVLAWTENRMQRLAGSGGEFRPRAIAQSLSIYVSSQGRLFNRRSATNRKGDAGKREGVGETGHSATGGLRDTRFQGDSLVISTELGSGARLMTVAFTNGFSGCSAKLSIAREAGKQTMQVKSLADGRAFEVQSVTADALTCAVKDGNVFGE